MGGHEPSPPSSHPNLPRIIWGHDGETIMAVDPTSEKVIWSRKVDSVVAAMYGVVGDKWVDVDIVQESPPSSADPSSNGNNVVVEYWGDQWAKVRMNCQARSERASQCRKALHPLGPKLHLKVKDRAIHNIPTRTHGVHGPTSRRF